MQSCELTTQTILPRDFMGKHRWLKVSLVSLLVLNLVDLVSTTYEVEVGLATEANPLMALAFLGGPAVFAFAKLLLVSAGVMMLWTLRGRRSTLPATLAATAVYAGVVFYHATQLGALALHTGLPTTAVG